MAEILTIVVTVVEVLTAVVDLLKVTCKAGNDSRSLAEVREDLKVELDRLLALRKDKEDDFLRDTEQKVRTELYKDWKRNVSKIEDEVSFLNKEYEKKWYHRRGNGYFLEKFQKALKKVQALLDDACLGNTLADKLQVERVIKEIDVQPIEEYETLTKAFFEIQDRLKEKEVKCVALGGQIGVGKTTIMRHLNNLFYDRSEFHMVLFIRVASNEQTDLQILHKIADRIKVDREVTDVDEFARRIQKVLEKNIYLLILDGLTRKPDEIWRKLDLSNHRKESKVVIASHYQPAWRSACVQKFVELDKLSPHEAHEMFRNIVGEDLSVPKAIQVCDKLCHCLPLLIDPIARSFKYHPPLSARWEQTLDQWMRWPQVGVEGVNELYSNLKNCFDSLGDKSKKNCFLYASLYPANSKIYTHHFVECCIVQELLTQADATAAYSSMLSQAINGTLKYLVDVAFLEKGEEMSYVQMNDLYRQLALYISSDDSNSEFKICVDDEAITSVSCQRPIWLSMVGSEKDSLTANQNFSRLQTLLLQKNLKLAEISEDCLRSMRNLHVLNLYGTKIRKLPYLSKLANLKAFYLYGCSDLQIELSEIESLKHLQVLDIRGTRINSVPDLKRLWCLRMSYTKKDDCYGIARLKNLEELIIEVKSPLQWCDDDAKCIVKHVASLKSLTTFGCSFPSSESLKEFEETSKSWRSEKQLRVLRSKFYVGCEDPRHSRKSWGLLTTEFSSM